MKSQLIIEVLSSKRERLTKAKVDISTEGKKVSAKLNETSRLYETEQILPGLYNVKVSAPGLQAETREVMLSSGKHNETFIVGKKGSQVYYRGRVKVPFTPRPGQLAVSLRGNIKEADTELGKAAGNLKLKKDKSERKQEETNVRIFTHDTGWKEQEIQKIIERLSRLKGVRKVGQILEMDELNLVFLSDEIIVKFKGDVEPAEAEALIKRQNGEVLRTIPYLGNAYHVQFVYKATYDILDICQNLVRSGRVEYAEPNVVNRVVDFAVNPTDFLYGSQWHIPLIDLPDAWQSLQDINADLTFGSPDVVLSVMDRGIVTATSGGIVSAAHADFQPTLTDGTAKVDIYFDFDDMVANNDSPPNDHGMGCAGVAGACANNSSVVVGENEGVAGAAPNVKLMGVIRPAGGTETDYSDVFIWQAGFNANSVTPGFPAVLARGADIITCSFGWSAWPLSGLMMDTMNYVTTYGRNGKGTLMFFAAGNGNTNFRLEAGLSAHPKTFAIAASTDGDVKAPYSSFGDDIDVCAPSNGGAQGIFTADLLNGGNRAGHTGGNNDYRNNFGGTSSATPLVAGVSALMLSVNPSLTWVEVRQILKDNAVKIDAASTNATGRWVDQLGRNSAHPMYSGPFYSQWYGSGRIDAAASVNAARDYDFSRDIVVRDNLLDTGIAPSVGTFWEGPDIWVRKTDNVAPANYGTHANSVHEQPDFGSPCRLHIRYKNIGTSASYPFGIRAYITHWPGTEFVYPASYIPSVRPGGVIPSPLVPGTYLIGEASVATAGAGGEGIVTIPWPANLIPPASVMLGGMSFNWHPCILVEITPQDGFTPPGIHIRQNNNLAQKNISINYDVSSGTDFAFAAIAGKLLRSRTKFTGLEFQIQWPVPRDVNAWIAFEYKIHEAYIEKQILAKKIKDLKVGKIKDLTVFYFARKKSIRINVPFIGFFPFIVGGDRQKMGVKEKFIIDVLQTDDNGQLTGGLQFEVRGAKRR